MDIFNVQSSFVTARSKQYSSDTYIVTHVTESLTESQHQYIYVLLQQKPRGQQNKGHSKLRWMISQEGKWSKYLKSLSLSYY